MSRDSNSGVEVIRAVVGIAAEGTEDWTTEFLFLSPRHNDNPATLPSPKPTDTKDVKFALLADEEDIEKWDEEGEDDESWAELAPASKVTPKTGGVSFSVEATCLISNCSLMLLQRFR